MLLYSIRKNSHCFIVFSNGEESIKKYSVTICTFKTNIVSQLHFNKNKLNKSIFLRYPKINKM